MYELFKKDQGSTFQRYGYLANRQDVNRFFKDAVSPHKLTQRIRLRRPFDAFGVQWGVKQVAEPDGGSANE